MMTATAQADACHATRYGTRWGRTMVMVLLCFAFMAGLIAAARTRLLASSFTLQNATAEVATSGLDATNAAFAVLPETRADGTTVYLLRGGFANGSFDGICVSQKQTLLGLPYTVTVKAGNNTLGGTYELTARDVQLDLTSLRVAGQSGSPGNGLNLDGRVQLGVAAQDVTTTSTNGVADPNPMGAPLGQGYWGLQADAAHLYNVRGTVYDLNIRGGIFLPGLSIKVSQTANGCNDPSNSPPPLPK